MKILFFTPVMIDSAIARMASLVVLELLKQGQEVSIIASEDQSNDSGSRFDFGCDIHHWNEIEKVKLLANNADCIIYQIGDNYKYHRGCLEWMQRLPGIVSLHDIYLGSIFYRWAVDHLNESDAILKLWYGNNMANAFFSHKGSDDHIAQTHQVTPMTEWISSMAKGVIIHSAWGSERVLNACPGPVYQVPLPYNVQSLESAVGNNKRKADGKLKILTVGHINRNKRAAQVIEAIGGSNLLKRRFSYQLVGEIQPDIANELMALADHHGVELSVSGKVTGTELSSAYNTADLISCLRWPCLEGASASVVEAMLQGKPIMVTDAGFYAEIPNDYVCKITQDNETDEIRKALENFIENPDEFYVRGNRAKDWAETTFTASNYASKILEMTKVLHRIDPVRSMINHFSEILMSWGSSRELIASTLTGQEMKIFLKI